MFTISFSFENVFKMFVRYPAYNISNTIEKVVKKKKYPMLDMCPNIPVGTLDLNLSLLWLFVHQS